MSLSGPCALCPQSSGRELHLPHSAQNVVFSGCLLSHCPVVVNKHHDLGNSYKRNHLTGNFTVSETYFIFIAESMALGRGGDGD